MVRPDPMVSSVPYAKKEIPGIENYVRCFFPQSLGIQPEGDTEIFLESACMYADLSLFDLFHFPILTGDAHIPDVSNWAILSSRKAEQFFGTQNPIGRIIRAKYTYREDSGKEFQIIAVMDNLPPTSSIQADIILSPVHEKDIFERWGVIGTHLFLQLDDQADPAEIEKAIPLLTAKLFPREPSATKRLNFNRSERSIFIPAISFPIICSGVPGFSHSYYAALPY